ncbi:MAG: hypothetical protein ACXABY_04365 [Candidatus Thorarchaeota archaeon]|jgi:hypothetical protein
MNKRNRPKKKVVNTRNKPKLDFSVRTHVHKEPMDTEVSAAVKALAHASDDCRRVYQYLVNIYPEGATDDELCNTLFFSANRRRVDLKHAGLVTSSGRKRETPRGSLAHVWVIVRD